MMKMLKIQIVGIKAAFAGRMAYRADFVISSLITLAGDMVIPLVTYLIYSNGVSFPGWNLYEVLLFQGIFILSRGIAFSFFFGAVWSTLSSVREGTFDLLLLKPHPTLNVVMAASFGCDNLGMILGGLALSGYALAKLPPSGIAAYAAFGALFVLSLMVLFSFAVIMSSLVFKWVGNSRVYEIFDSITLFGQYPATIFSKAVADLFTWMAPVFMISFIPASVLLVKPAGGLIPAVAATFALTALSLLLWHFMKKQYTSAGG